MWFLDKMTSISEEGFGRVLGGKPIKYKEVNEDLGISRRTYINWINILKNGRYIKTTRTPAGLVIIVNKAKKRFKRDVQKITHHKEKRDVQNLDSDVQKNVSDVQNSDIQYKTVTKTDNKDSISKEIVKPTSYGNEDINKIYAFLKEQLGGTPDGTIKQNRQFAKLLLNKFKKDYPDKEPAELICFLIKIALKDDFHSKNATSFKYLYYNAQKIISSMKQKINNPKYVKIS